MIVLKNCRETVRYTIKIGARQINSSIVRLNDELVEKEQPPSFFEEPEVVTVKCDKSGLRPAHRNRLHGKVPYSEPNSWIHLSQKYQRKMFGRYGSESGMDPRICFDTKEDMAAQAEYERVAQHLTLSEMIKNVNIEKAQRSENIKKRESEIEKKLEKLDQWKSELNAKIAKKEADSLAAKERKERYVEEVRRHFGFNIDSRDERFKEMLEQKEKEDKKKQKDLKRKAKEEKMMAKLVEKSLPAE